MVTDDQELDKTKTNMRKINIPLILGAITVAELITCHTMEGSLGLWLFYGLYQLIKLL